MQNSTQTAEVASYKFEGIAHAISAVSHLGDSTGGTISVFRREKMLVDGRIMEIPVISGNSIRGLLRDRGMRFMLRALGDPVLSPGAFDFLTSGGALSKTAGRGIDIGFARRLRNLIPLVGIFGGACGNQIPPGKLQVGKWYPVCTEMRSKLPLAVRDLPEAALSVFDMTDLHSFTRTDDKKNDHMQKWLPAPERTLLEAPNVTKDKEGREVAKKEPAQQMRYTQEVLIAGVKFSCWFLLQDVTPLEKAAFASALYEWSKAPFIGGQSRHGLGLIELDLSNWMQVMPLARFAEAESERFALSPAEEYEQHLTSAKADILAVLKEVQ